MSLSKTIVSIRQKPESVRQRILAVTMIIITTIVLVSWFFIFKYERSAAEGASGEIRFFKSIGNSISNTIRSVKD